MSDDKVVRFGFSKEAQGALDRLIRQQVAAEGLTLEETTRICGRLWLAWVKIGDRAGLLPVEAEYPEWATAEQRIELSLLWKAATHRALNAYSAAVFHERAEHEVELIKAGRHSAN